MVWKWWLVFSLFRLYHSFNLAEHQASTLESTICAHHIYKQNWQLLVRELLTLEQEESNNRQDKFAVSLRKDATVAGHVLREFSRVFWHILRHNGTIACSAILFVLYTTWQFAPHVLLKVQFVKHVHLTHDG